MICGCGNIFVWRNKMSGSSFKSITQPYFILYDMRENLLIYYCTLIPHYKKFLVKFYQLTYVLSEQRERRIGYHDICLFQQFDTFGVSKVASFKFGKNIFVVLQKYSYIAEINRSIAIHIANFGNLHFVGRLTRLLVLIAKVKLQLISLHRRAIVACANKLL